MPLIYLYLHEALGQSPSLSLQTITRHPNTAHDTALGLCCRIDVIRADNERLKEELRELQHVKRDADTVAHKVVPVERKQPKKDSRRIPGAFDVYHVLWTCVRVHYFPCVLGAVY